ncbi:hypothetical protein D0Z00_001443 [Geotrichum galactomycetum]|uniref:Uncharacterized protein n=1 Tax=Geotrichum galactomycetum TaxID=27317 RepID=A0ACB6V730_9ASCO|nr:hypothetical protein D0Z00_001443 [Geotrichum candidum]
MVAEMTALASAAAAATSNGTSQTTDLRNRRYIPRPQTYEQFQLLLLIQSFQLLSHGLDIPDKLQLKLTESLTEPIKTAPVKKSGPLFEQTPINYDVLKTREARAKIPPIGGKQKSQSVTGVCEQIISNRITARITELDRLPANLGTLNAHDVELDPAYKISTNEDELKMKAVLELKALTLLTKQKMLRQHIVFNMAGSSDPLAESMNVRFSNRRIRLHNPHEYSLTEQLQSEQKTQVETEAHERHLDSINGIVEHASQVLSEEQNRRTKRLGFGKSILNAHTNIEKDEQKRAERTAKQRLQALRANDEEAYIKLLDQTKDTRITHLLRQTNSFLDSLAQAVKVQQADVSIPEDEVTEETDKEKIDYYQVAHRVKEEVKIQPSILVGGTLKEYQLKGLQWMVSLYNNKLNGILADEMGLGKTIQSISLITYLIEVKRQPGPYLVIVPLSTMTNWNLEFEKWAPAVKKIVYKGPPPVRRAQQNQIKSGDFQVLLTTFEYIIKDRPILGKIKWVHMIIDEGHRMKNTQSKLSYTLTTYYTSQYRLILTGTPLQNNLPELWALLNFVLPKIFNSVKTFDEWFNTPFANTGGQDKIELTEEESLLIIRRLHKVLRPFLLRRLKKDVEKDLPDKVEKVVKCKMSSLQLKLYQQMLKHNVLFVGESTKSGLRGLNNRIMQLRKICNHPFVFEEVESLINPSKVTNDNLWRVAGKFELLDRILPKFKKTGHRVLMFFQMTQIMDIMEDFLRFRGLQYLRLDGSTKADDRSHLLKLFNAPNSPYFAFLLSTRAGGLGLNLQTADTVIIYDTDWNPHQDLQAQDRAHRIGQTKEVRILRLITEDSVEEAILSRAHAKLEIDGKVIQAGKFDNKSTAEEQEAFLRSLLEAEEAKRNQVEEDDDMDDDELNEILARNEDEAEIFHQMDVERVKNSPYGKDKKSGKDRLMAEWELPIEYKQDIQKQLEPVQEEVLGRGARDRKKVFYDDGLTELQWLEAVDKDAETLEEAISKKREKLEKGRLTKDQDEVQEEQLPQEEKVEVEEKRKRKRTASATPKAESTPDKHESTNTEPDHLPPTKRAASNKEMNNVHTTQKQQLKSMISNLLDRMNESTDKNGRNRADLFITLPERRLYPDYYQLIKKPVALDTIRRKLDKGIYRSFDTVRRDALQLCENAFTYNQAGSQVYEDAEALKAIVDDWYTSVSATAVSTTKASDASSKSVNSSFNSVDKKEGSTGRSNGEKTEKKVPRLKIVLKQL